MNRSPAQIWASDRFMSLGQLTSARNFIYHARQDFPYLRDKFLALSSDLTNLIKELKKVKSFEQHQRLCMGKEGENE